MNNIENIRNLFNNKNQQEEEIKRRIQESDEIKRSENKAIFEKTGLPQILTTIATENLFKPGLQVDFGNHNSIISLHDCDSYSSDNYVSVYFQAFITKENKVVLGNLYPYIENGRICGKELPDGNISNFIFNAIIKSEKRSSDFWKTGLGTGWKKYYPKYK